MEDLKEHLLNDQQLLEAVAVPATYNMVSRLLVALDVGELGNEALPLPETNQSEHYVEVEGDVKLYVKVAKRILDGETAPWIICVNSLMSNEKMWEGVLPRLSKKYNLLTYDQRGHGRVSLSPSSSLFELLTDNCSIVDRSYLSNDAPSTLKRHRHHYLLALPPHSNSFPHRCLPRRCYSTRLCPVLSDPLFLSSHLRHSNDCPGEC